MDDRLAWLFAVRMRVQELEYPLHLAVDGRQFLAAEILLQNGALVDAIDARRDTALHIAVRMEDERLVRLLLEYGADPTVRNLRHRTPYQLAMDKGLEALATAIRQSEGEAPLTLLW